MLVMSCSAGDRAATDDGDQLAAGEQGADLAGGGALVDVSIESKVAVVLDEIPAADRARAARFYLGQPRAFWVERAKLQIRHTNYRLVYRDFFYDESENKRTLPLPPEELWQFELNPASARRVTTRDGHDAVQLSYKMKSTLVTDRASPEAAEPALRRVGGVWEEPFNLPLDPEFLFQRTGYACMDEDGYPLETARSENAYQLFDQDCGVETEDTASCHLTTLPKESCLDALAAHVGRVDTAVHYQRVAYDAKKARAARVGNFTVDDSPDLQVLGDQLGVNWVEYRYIPEDSCAIQEQCVGGPGWRRLILFNASMRNTGRAPLEVGNVTDSAALRHNLFEFSACHEHYHFRHYGDFSYGTIPGDKRAFCVESTDRYYNNESTPLVHDFSCENQGVAPGWGDTYIAGVECNWIDVTDLPIGRHGTRQDLKFVLNPDDFLCEGAPVVDASGTPLYEPTSFVTETGAPVDRPVCEFIPNHANNNTAKLTVKLPQRGSIVTAACTRKQAGPLRDCGFTETESKLACKPGKKVRLRCSVGEGASSQALRVCESSSKLGGIACAYDASLASVVADADGENVTFECPSARGSDEPGGLYALYTAPLVPGDAAAKVSCTPL
jgi:Lysyl oxidase